MSQHVVTVNRSMIGAISLVLLSVSGILTLVGIDSQEIWSGACLKVGLVMGAFWLVLPTFTRRKNLGEVSLTLLLTALAASLLVASTKIPLKIVLPVIIVTAILVRFLWPSRKGPTRPHRVE